MSTRWSSRSAASLVPLLLGGCNAIAGIEEKPCEPGCVDEATRLVCDASETPSEAPCPVDRPSCVGGQCVSLAADEAGGVAECEPGCVDQSTIRTCDGDGTPRDQPCPGSPHACASAVCLDGRCGFEPAVGEACGSDGAGRCNEGYACLGPQTRISALRLHTCVVTDDGLVFCWGDNTFGELGDGSLAHAGHPVWVRGLPGPARDVSAGYAHTCALMQDGSVYCWGNNFGGQCGLGRATQDPVLTPSRVDAGGVRFVAVSAGQGHTCALADDATVTCWGNTLHGQCGVDPADGGGETIVGPTRVGGLTSVRTVETVKNHTCALRNGQPSLVCWGSNTYIESSIEPVHKLGPAAADLPYSATPVPVDLGSEVIDIGMSYESTFALSSDRVWAWGFNGWSHLGVGEAAETVMTPMRVLVSPELQDATRYSSPHLINAVSITRTDGTDQCVEMVAPLLTGTRHVCWGNNDAGEVGLGTLEAVEQRIFPLPMPTILPSTARQLVRGENHGCFIDVAEPRREIYCYGRGSVVGIGLTSDDEPTDPEVVPAPVQWLPENFAPALGGL